MPITESGIFRVSPEKKVITFASSCFFFFFLIRFQFYLFFRFFFLLAITFITNYSDHPCDHIAQRSNPNDAHKERYRKPILESWLFTIRNSTHEN